MSPRARARVSGGGAGFCKVGACLAAPGWVERAARAPRLLPHHALLAILSPAPARLRCVAEGAPPVKEEHEAPAAAPPAPRRRPATAGPAAALTTALSLQAPASKRQRKGEAGAMRRQPSAAELVVGAAAPHPQLPEVEPLLLHPQPLAPSASPLPAPLTPQAAEAAQRAAVAVARQQAAALAQQQAALAQHAAAAAAMAAQAGRGRDPAAAAAAQRFAAQYTAAAQHAAHAVWLQQPLSYEHAVLSGAGGAGEGAGGMAAAHSGPAGLGAGMASSPGAAARHRHLRPAGAGGAAAGAGSGSDSEHMAPSGSSCQTAAQLAAACAAAPASSSAAAAAAAAAYGGLPPAALIGGALPAPGMHALGGGAMAGAAAPASQLTVQVRRCGVLAWRQAACRANSVQLCCYGEPHGSAVLCAAWPRSSRLHASCGCVAMSLLLPGLALRLLPASFKAAA